ncbi:MAG: hypothetical protein ACRDD1_18935 [Planctomycetia bacterium]
MIEKALTTISTFGVAILCVVLAIMALSLFYAVLNRFNTSGEWTHTLALRGVLKKDVWTTVHMAGAETFERVRFVGFTTDAVFKAHLPNDLCGMVILEDAEGRRFLIRARSIRLIVVPPAAMKPNADPGAMSARTRADDAGSS